MANSRFQYVRLFEENDACLANTYMVVRVDGRRFTKFAKLHGFEKPNDGRALELMNIAASKVCKEFSDVLLAYGQSDEYSFAFRRDAEVFNRRRSKILSTIASLFSSAYVFYWAQVMGDESPLKHPPQFDARMVLYPSLENLRDYFRWRQADCHINNLYNTAFWALVTRKGCSETEAEKLLKGTLAKDKNELLFTHFQINYNDESPMFKKGSVIRNYKTKTKNFPNAQSQGDLEIEHCDMMKADFWESFPGV